jgi:hypothetical protein
MKVKSEFVLKSNDMMSLFCEKILSSFGSVTTVDDDTSNTRLTLIASGETETTLLSVFGSCESRSL